MDMNASVSDYQECVSNINVWLPIFVREDLVEDDTLISFLNKLKKVKLGNPCMMRIVSWDLTKESSQLILII